MSEIKITDGIVEDAIYNILWKFIDSSNRTDLSTVDTNCSFSNVSSYSINMNIDIDCCIVAKNTQIKFDIYDSNDNYSKPIDYDFIRLKDTVIIPLNKGMIMKIYTLKYFNLYSFLLVPLNNSNAILDKFCKMITVEPENDDIEEILNDYKNRTNKKNSSITKENNMAIKENFKELVSGNKELKLDPVCEDIIEDYDKAVRCGDSGTVSKLLNNKTTHIRLNDNVFVRMFSGNNLEDPNIIFGENRELYLIEDEELLKTEFVYLSDGFLVMQNIDISCSFYTAKSNGGNTINYSYNGNNTNMIPIYKGMRMKIHNVKCDTNYSFYFIPFSIEK